MQRFLTFIFAILMVACATTSSGFRRHGHRALMDGDDATEGGDLVDKDDIVGPKNPLDPSPGSPQDKEKRKKDEEKPECQCPEVSIDEEFVESADYLLRVRIQDAPEAKGKLETVFASVVTAYKGESEKTIKLNIDNSCGDNTFTKGRQYTIRPELSVHEGKFKVGPCSGSKEWKSLPKADKKFLSEASTTVKTPATDPLPAVLRVVDDKTVMESYQTCTQLNKDLVQALRFYASNIIIGKDFCRYKPGGDFFTPFDTESSGQGGGNSGETDFETNNQIAATEEADIVKYDGSYVYLAYGDTLVVWDKRKGDEIIRVTMPPPAEAVSEECNALGLNVTDASSAGQAQFCFAAQSRAAIEGLLLEEGRLVLIVSGYTVYFKRREEKPNVLSDYGASTVRIYDTSKLKSNGKLPLVGRTELQGQYKEGRAIGSMAHIATTLRVNIESHLDAELDESNFQGIQGTSYRAAATARAIELIPAIAKSIVKELKAGNNKCQSVSKLSAFMKADLNGKLEVSDETRCNLQDTISFQTLVKVSSFNILEELKPGEGKRVAKIPTGSAAAFFSKEGPSIVTASNDRMIFTANGYHWNETELSTQSFTYIQTFRLPSEGKKVEAVPSTFGFVDGYPVTRFAIDEHEGNLRIGTTKGDEYYCIDTVTVEGEVRCAEWESYEPESQVVILKYSSDGGSMKEIGRVGDLGNGEELRAVLFDGDKAFASTFGINEPFHSLDLSDPKNPFVAGTVEVSGFSTYLHMIEDFFLLGVGEVTDELGFPLGLAVNLFDVSDLENPKLSSTYEFEDEAGGFILSDALYDPKSFRYVEGEQKLILPVKVNGGNPEELMDGFAVLQIDLDEESIEFEFMINHANYTQSNSCFSTAYVPSRSIVSLGRLITMKGHAVVSTGIDSQKERYRIVLDEKRVEECNNWFPEN